MTPNQLPIHDRPKPQVMTWFQVYCAVLCVLYLIFAASSLVFFVGVIPENEMPPPMNIIIGSIFLVSGLVLFVACLVPFFLPPKPWVWIYDLVIICMGMTSACFLPICIPLLIFWLKPEAKAYFGRI